MSCEHFLSTVNHVLSNLFYITPCLLASLPRLQPDPDLRVGEEEHVPAQGLHLGLRGVQDPERVDELGQRDLHLDHGEPHPDAGPGINVF